MKVIANKYRLIRLIGSGAMGEVFLGEVLGSYGFVKKIAVKLLPRNARKDRIFREAFIREATILAGISHPNLVNVFDFGDAGDRLFLCMEYIRGFSLRELIRTTEKWGEEIPLEIVIKITEEMLEGIRFIHGNGVIHGDLSPKNIMVGSQGELKILDFGLSRFSSQVQSDVPLGGKAGYIAPEIRKEKRILPASDIYSLGAILRETVGDRYGQQVTKPGDGSDIQRELFDIVELCLDENPGSRPEAVVMLEKVKEFKRRIDSGFEIKDYLNQVYNEEDYTFLVDGGEEGGERKKYRLHIPLVTGLMLLFFSVIYIYFRVVYQANSTGRPVDRVDVPEIAENENFREDTVKGDMTADNIPRGSETVNLERKRAGSEMSGGEWGTQEPKAVEKETDVFTINSYPENASVFFNGKNLGKTPVDMGFSPIVGSGVKVFRLVLEGYKEKVIEISGQKVAEGGNYFVVLQRATGFLRVNVNPWAYVFIDGKKLGTTPILDEILPVGEHTILLTNDRLGVTMRKTVEVKEGKTYVFIEDFYD